MTFKLNDGKVEGKIRKKDKNKKITFFKWIKSCNFHCEDVIVCVEMP